MPVPPAIDLSQEIHPEMQLFPAFPHPAVVLWTKRETYGFETEVIFMATHTGTHLDAPYHFDASGRRVDQLPVDSLLRDAVLLDFTWKGAKEYISAADVREASRNIPIHAGDIAVIKTGWERYLGSPAYLSTYPGLARDAAEYLVEQRVAAVAVDDPNPDHPDDARFPVHNTLLPRGVLIIENLANLDMLPVPRFRFLALPLRLRNGTGSPLRAVALVD